MSREKQIEEMAREIYENTDLSIVEIAENIAEHLYEAGYRKQSEGEWIKPTSFSQTLCSKCRMTPKMLLGLLPKYCPNCGAKMKGGAE